MDSWVDYAKSVLDIEAKAILDISKRIDDKFSAVVRAILECKGRVVLTGMGKSGDIGRKISSTLTCTGTASFFLHPAEAFHGDLGMLKKEDLLLAISYSGETEELLKIIAFVKDNGNLLVSLTGNSDSTLAKCSDNHLNVYVEKEACPFQVAPTASTTACLAIGDAIALTVMKQRGFNAEDFARFHPGGYIGRRLLTSVKDVMIKEMLPVLRTNAIMKDIIQHMTSSRTGIAVITDDDQHILGIITDGDLRRALNTYENIFILKPEDIMSTQPKTVHEKDRLIEAEQLMTTCEIATLLVLDDDERFVGILQFHDI